MNMEMIYRHENQQSEFVELWKREDGSYETAEWVYNGKDYMDLYFCSFSTLTEANQFILNIWFR